MSASTPPERATGSSSLSMFPVLGSQNLLTMGSEGGVEVGDVDAKALKLLVGVNAEVN